MKNNTANAPAIQTSADTLRFTTQTVRNQRTQQSSESRQEAKHQTYGSSFCQARNKTARKEQQGSFPEIVAPFLDLGGAHLRHLFIDLLVEPYYPPTDHTENLTDPSDKSQPRLTRGQ